jgi:nucleoside-diphosphate-sugar epimerase
MIRDRSILLTGGAGFLGSHLCERLIDANRITVYDNGARDALRYTALREHPNLTYVAADILDPEALARAAQGAEIFVHLAAIAGVSNYYERPVDTMQTNILGTSTLLQVARQVQPERIIHFSSSEVYGPEASGARESDETTQGDVKVSRWTYSVSKLAGEHLGFAYHRQYGLPVVAVRPFNIYGPRQVGEGAIQIFTPLALRGEPITIYNGGSQTRAWCYVDDFVDGIVACLSHPDAVGEVFNLGNPIETVTVLALAQRIIEICGSKSELVFQAWEPAGDVRFRVPNIEKAESVLGFRPRVSLDAGLRRTVDWYRDVYDGA